MSNLYLLGHLGFTAVIGFILDKKFPMDSIESNKLNNNSIKWFLLFLGSMIPDILDKTLGIFIFSTGRWFGHTLLLILLECGLLIILIRFLSETHKFSYFLVFWFFSGKYKYS